MHTNATVFIILFFIYLIIYGTYLFFHTDAIQGLRGCTHAKMQNTLSGTKLLRNVNITDGRWCPHFVIDLLLFYVFPFLHLWHWLHFVPSIRETTISCSMGHSLPVVQCATVHEGRPTTAFGLLNYLLLLCLFDGNMACAYISISIFVQLYMFLCWFPPVDMY